MPDAKNSPTRPPRRTNGDKWHGHPARVTKTNGTKSPVVMNGPDVALGSDSGTTAKKRRMVADFCRLMGEQLTGQPAKIAVARTAEEILDDQRVASLAPRVQQTLGRLLAGDSEKEIAVRLQVSKHTIHVYVKTLYRHFSVNSRGELLAHFVANTYRTPAVNR